MNVRVFPALMALFAILVLTGCNEVYPIAWSPDGNTMALIAADGLRLGDASGKLGPPLLANATRVAWLPDSKNILVGVEVLAASWAEAKALLDAQQQKDAVELAQYTKQLLISQGQKALDDDARVKNASDWRLSAAVLYLRDTEATLLKEKLGRSDWETLRSANLKLYSARLRDTTLASSITHNEVWRGVSAIEEMRVSPDGKYAAIVHKGDSIFAGQPIGDHEIELVSLQKPLDKESPRIVSTSPHAAWSPDGRRLLAVRSISDGDSIGSLVSVPVRGEDGGPLNFPGLKSSTQLHLGSAGSSQIACKRDGTIVFTSSEVQLPSTEQDMSGTQNVFSYKDDDQVLRRLLTRSDAESMKRLTSLALNSNEQWLALGSSTSELLEILQIGTGSGKQMRMDPKFDPCWRNSDEVCYAKPVDTKTSNRHDSEVVLHSISAGKDRVISQSWPRSAVDGFLIHKK